MNPAADDPTALGAQMAAYAAQQRLRGMHGQAGRQRVAERFSLAQMLSAYAGVYDELLEERGVAH